MDYDARDAGDDFKEEGIELTGGALVHPDDEVADDTATSTDEVGVVEIEKMDNDDELDTNSLDIPYDDSDATAI